MARQTIFVAAMLLVCMAVVADAGISPAQRRRFAADLMASQSPCEAVKSFDVDTCAAVCDCVQDLAKAGRSRAALCNTYCNKCAVKARTCDAKPLSGICLKIVTNNMVKQCVAEVAGFGASRE